jgi:hypothetical protein
MIEGDEKVVRRWIWMSDVISPIRFSRPPNLHTPCLLPKPGVSSANSSVADDRTPHSKSVMGADGVQCVVVMHVFARNFPI